MTLTLILMRHAKSSWDDPLVPDHDRVLNARGQRSARALGDWLRANELVPDEVISSSSIRTRQTFEGLALDLRPRFTSALYHAGPAQMWTVLSEASGQRVLMLGHNPGIAEFGERIVSTPPDHERFWDYPTGATLVAEFDAQRWTDVRPHTGRVLQFITPRELTE
ncbi:MAG: histidine phosphatase family protein [Aestuariivita sp.]|uniref:SixA phosphatase family protein n=1 Tax=Aestuariivita sp. TaxID=1872407 RepID=UPI003BB13BF2